MHPQPKTGILTFHRCINYGSYWQTRCLLEGLRALGHDAVVLDHDSARINRAEWRCALQPVLPARIPPADYPRYAAKTLRFFRAFSALPRSRRFPLDHPEKLEPFDTVVVGSDEVWNLTHPWYGGCPLFWGRGLRTGRLIAYAASFGNYDAAAGLGPHWADRLRSFAAISVRDDNSRKIVESALGSEPALVLDPCLQFPPRPEGRWHGPQRRFVAVYGHGFSAGFGRAVRRWARARGSILLSIGYRNDWADRQWLAAGPHDFAQAMERADAVATNFFHGCVFALHHGKPFACESSPYRFHKVRDLMAMIGGEAHLMSAATPAEVCDRLLGEPPEPAILRLIDDLRRASANYLDRALS